MNKVIPILAATAWITMSACLQVDELPPEEPQAVAVTRNALVLAPIVPIHDTRLMQVAQYANDGNSSTLAVSAVAGQQQRALLRFNQATINTAVAGRSVYSARIELTVNNVSMGWNGGQLGIHRMTRTWNEGNGATGAAGSTGPSWRCANDTNTSGFGNFTNDCTAANRWGMSAGDADPLPYATAPTDRTPLWTNAPATVSFDVTTDVRAFIAGTANHGWMLRAETTLSGAFVEFASRQNALFAPRLILDVGDDLCLTSATKVAPGQCGCDVADVDTDGDGIMDCAEPTLQPIADTTLRLAVPYGNDGVGSLLGVTSASIAGLERTLIRFDQAQIAALAAGKVVQSAELELDVAGVALGWGGGVVDVNPMTRTWVEGGGIDTVLGANGASWFCANDTNTSIPGNGFNDCTVANRWGMQPWDLDPRPFVATPTASVPIFTSGSTVRFDVTADVQRFVAGTATNHGWMIKGREDLLSGQWVNFFSSETERAPRLRLTLGTDLCPADGSKTGPGQCGCGVPDLDSDSDGTANCRDECPNDPDHIEPGNCGCVGEANLKPAGTACYDGFCESANQCDGDGNCGHIDDCLPEPTCFGDEFDGHAYVFCPTAVTWTTARTRCMGEPEMGFVSIDSPEENDFVQTNIAASSWLGANDGATEGTWLWDREGDLFWTGTSTGTAAEYSSWDTSNPAAAAAGNDCGYMDVATGRWRDSACGTARGYVCEINPRSGVALPGTIINILEGIEDPDEQSGAALRIFTVQRALCNVEQGTVQSDLEVRLHQTLTQGRTAAEITQIMAMVDEMCANLPDESTRDRYLGPLASADPLDTDVLASGQSISRCDAVDALTMDPAHLRANFCSEGVSADPRAITVSTERIEQQILDDLVLMERFEIGAAPVIIGLQPVSDNPQFEDVRRDWLDNRTPSSPPGDDGYNMMGVRTVIPCTTGSCDSHLGHICSSERSEHGAIRVQVDPGCDPTLFGNVCPVVDVDHCIAYPLAQAQDDITLIGYNFWDPCSAKLVLRDVQSGQAFTLDVLGVGTAGEGSDESVACTPSPDGLRLAAAGINSSAAATFGTAGQSIPLNRFYTLEMLNKNGTFIAQHDAQERQLPGANIADIQARALHVCWDCDPSVPNTNCPATCATGASTGCARARCAQPINETCLEDGCTGSLVTACNPTGGSLRDGTCASSQWSGTPRTLENAVCFHEPDEAVRCAETPFWLGSQPGTLGARPIIFLEEGAPEYRVTVRVPRIEAEFETGSDCFFCNDDHLVAHMETYNQAAANAVVDTWDYDKDFDEGQVRDVNGEMSSVKVRRDASLLYDLLYTEADNFTLESVLASALAAAAGGYVCGPVCAGIAGGVTGTATIGYSDFISGVDVMGGDKWTASVPRLLQAHGESRLGDLMGPISPRLPIPSVPRDNHGPSSTRKIVHGACDHLMHPFDRGYLGSLRPTGGIESESPGVVYDCLTYYDHVRQCGPGYTGAVQCSASNCFAGRCTSASVLSNGCHPSDAFCGNGTGAQREKGFFERRDIAADDDAGQARYIWDLEYRILTCDAHVGSGDPLVCQEP